MVRIWMRLGSDCSGYVMSGVFSCGTVRQGCGGEWLVEAGFGAVGSVRARQGKGEVWPSVA